MTEPHLTPYAENSPEAMLRIIALFIVSDGELAEAEIDVLDRLGVLDTLGVDREAFALVFDTSPFKVSLRRSPRFGEQLGG
jgi:hypothetical protein